MPWLFPLAAKISLSWEAAVFGSIPRWIWRRLSWLEFAWNIEQIQEKV